MALRPAETPQEHIRTALQLLGEVENQLCVLGLLVPERSSLVRLLTVTRRQLWLALAALESRPSRRGWWVWFRPPGRKRGGAVMIWLAVVRWPARALAFAVRGVWRTTRVAIRTVHAIWP